MSSTQEITGIKKRLSSSWSEQIPFATTLEHVYADDTKTQTLQDLINSLCVQPGTTIYTFNGGGYITTSSKVIAFTVPINKIINGATIQSFSILDCQIRENNNYLVNTTLATPTVPVEDLTLNITTINNCGLNCNLTYTPNGGEQTAFPNATNNSALGIYIKLSITWA